MQTVDEEVIQDGEVVEEVTETPVKTTEQAEILINLDSLIKSNLKNMEGAREELRKLREMFDDAFNNDPVFREHSEKVKDVNKIKSETRAQIMKQPTVAQLAQKIKSIRQDMKESQMALSDYLLEYQRMSGANEIETEDGQVFEIVNSAKTVKRSS